MPGEFASPSLEEIDAAFAGWDSASSARPGASAPAARSAPVESPVAAPVPVPAKPAEPEPVVAATPPDLSASSLTTFDGDWPKLAAGLPMRGLAQQLAHQSELVAVECSDRDSVECVHHGSMGVHLRCDGQGETIGR